MSIITPPSSNRYQDFLRDIKTQVAQSRLGAARAVNRSLIGLYWSLGKMIVERQEELGWGSAVVDQLSADLRNEFPDMSGFSPRNLWDIKRFYETYASAPEFLRQLVAEIPWGQNILIFQRVKDDVARRYYLEATSPAGLDAQCAAQPNQGRGVSSQSARQIAQLPRRAAAALGRTGR